MSFMVRPAESVRQTAFGFNEDFALGFEPVSTENIKI